jgi:hypothetical protein
LVVTPTTREVAPGNPLFDGSPQTQIIHEIFGFSDTTTVDVLGVAGLSHDPLIG